MKTSQLIFLHKDKSSVTHTADVGWSYLLTERASNLTSLLEDEEHHCMLTNTITHSRRYLLQREDIVSLAKRLLAEGFYPLPIKRCLM